MGKFGPIGPNHRKPPVSAEGRKTRTCLSCQKPFDSDGIGNRICLRCKQTAVWRQPAMSDSGFVSRNRGGRSGD